MTAHPYYKYDKLFSYNAIYNFIVGGRGIGKTYGAKEKSIRAAITKGEQFIYLRRYKNELTTSRTTFFNDVEHKFPDYDLRVQGGIAQASHIKNRTEKKREWIVLGYFIALSTSQSQKSVAFNKVKTIIFDEFIIEKGAIRYLPDESTIFNNFFSTVDRYQDKTKVLFLANSVSIMNPYFIQYEIIPDESSEFVSKANGFILVHFVDAENFASSVYTTKFGKFIKDSDYADYAVGNTFADNHESMLARKASEARYMFTLECKNGSFSVWNNLVSDEYYVQANLPKAQIVFTLLSERMANDKILMSFTDRPLAYLRAAFRAGRVNFDKASTRNTFVEIFKR